MADRIERIAAANADSWSPAPIGTAMPYDADAVSGSKRVILGVGAVTGRITRYS